MPHDINVNLDQLSVNTIRFLAVDMVEKANSGHPGAPMGQAPLAYQLWTRHLRHNPANPQWPNRDRFVLSCGHASALLYSLLHLSGYDLPLDELKSFRQLGSKTPGHPEYHLTPGVETTTGPLGQGLGNAVGMALAQRMLAARFNRDDFPIIDHHVWVLASDGDMMEGVSSEASSLAGHLKLGRLNVFYDANGISIDGSTSLSFSEDVGQRYEAYGWHVLRLHDGNDLAAVDRAAEAAVAETECPTLILTHTHIGYGSPNKQDSAEAHGAPLGADEVRATKEALGWPLEPTFHVPEEVRQRFAEVMQQGAAHEAEWNELFERYRETHPELSGEFERRVRRELPAGWEQSLPHFNRENGDDRAMATRTASGKVINALARHLPELVGGSADLAGSNNTYQNDHGDFSADNRNGRNLYFGVREHAMGTVLNGMALSGMLIPYGGTFLIFSDYMRPSVRLAALMGQQVIYVYTHDSIFLGEDGPTHQPISHLLSLRSIPNLTVIRPADANETAAAWHTALLNRSGPTALSLTRQKLPLLPGTAQKAADGVARGAYLLSDCDGDPQLLLLATGSEVALAAQAQEELARGDILTRVISMPSWELFAAQGEAYQESVLPGAVDKRLAIEAATPLGWERWVGRGGVIMGVERFGASAPYQDLAKAYGFTVDEVVRRARLLLG